MQITISLDDNERQPRSFRLEPTRQDHGRVLESRILRALKTAIGNNPMSIDTTTPLNHPVIPPAEAEKFESAYIALYLNGEAMRELQKNPRAFPDLLKRFLPKGTP